MRSSDFASFPKPIFPKYVFRSPENTSNSSSSFMDSPSSSSLFANMTSTSRNYDTKACLINQNQRNFNSNPTAVKDSSNQEINRRVTLKLKNNLPEKPEKREKREKRENSEISTISSVSLTSLDSSQKRKTGENSMNFQGFNLKKDVNTILEVKSVFFVKMVNGKIVDKKRFRCFKEEQLQLPANLNKFLQKTENDDDVETDEETLDYYVKKVRSQLIEAVESERILKRKNEEKEAFEKKKKEGAEQKENYKKKHEENKGFFEREGFFARDKSLKLVENL